MKKIASTYTQKALDLPKRTFSKEAAQIKVCVKWQTFRLRLNSIIMAWSIKVKIL